MFVHSDEETRPNENDKDQDNDSNKDNYKDNPRELWHSKVSVETGQHSQIAIPAIFFFFDCTGIKEQNIMF